MPDDVTIRRAGEADFDALTELWHASVRTSHTFADEEDFAVRGPWIRDGLLPSMDVLVAEDAAGTPLGFVGARGDQVNLLYIAPEHQGRGLGTALLAAVDDGRGPRSVEVYADNTTGMAFYASQGFRETRRYPHDDLDRPFAVAHLER